MTAHDEQQATRAQQALTDWQTIRYGDSPETRAALAYYRERGWAGVDEQHANNGRLDDLLLGFRSGYREAVTALRGEAVGQAWQPIATAKPAPCNWVLLRVSIPEMQEEGDEYGDYTCLASLLSWAEPVPANERNGWTMQGRGYIPAHHVPTHWQPLPAPPAALSSAQEET